MQQAMVEARTEQQWLEQLVGEWTSESSMSPEGEKHRSTESVRAIGGGWVVAEGRDETDPNSYLAIMTLGYDPAKGRCVGTFVMSMMSNLWVYEGELDPSSSKLVLSTRGPSPADDGSTVDYLDTIEFLSPDHRTLTSTYRDAGGEWKEFMTAHYHRAR